MFKRKNSGNYWMSATIKGNRKQISLGTSDKKLATKKEIKIRLTIKNDEYLEKPSGAYITVQGLLGKYLKEVSVNKKSRKTDVQNAKPLRKYLEGKKLTAVTPSVLSGYKVSHQNDGVKSATIRLELALLSNAFTKATTEWEMLERNPFDKFTLPKPSKLRVRYLFSDEVERLFGVLNRDHAWMIPIVVTLFETGARLTNVLRMKWSQIDFKRKIINLPETKSGRPVVVPLTKTLEKELSALKKEASTSSKVVALNAFVFPRGRLNDGKPRNSRTFSRSFRNVCAKADIVDFRVHDCRHDLATRLMQNGTPIKVIMEWLGHSDIRTTLKYAHHSDLSASLRHAATQLDDFNACASSAESQVKNMQPVDSYVDSARKG